MTKMLVDEIAMAQITQLTEQIKGYRSSVKDENRREAMSCVNELIGKLDLAFALAEPYEENETENDG